MADADPQTAVQSWYRLAVNHAPSSGLNPAQLYVAELRSDASRETARSVIRTLASILGFTKLVETNAGLQTQPAPELVPWQDIDRSLVLSVLEVLKKRGKSTASRNLALSILKGIARQACLLQQMPENQFVLIKEVRALKGSRLPSGRALLVQEIQKLIDHCLYDEGLSGVRDAALLGVLFGCGPRRSEVVTIDIEKINFADRSVKVIGKGDKERELELPPRSIELVGTWLEEAGLTQGALFRPINKWGSIALGKRLTPRGVYDIVTRRMKEAGLDKASPHDLRRSFLTYLLDNDVDLATAADLAGHSSTDTTRRYLRHQKKRNRQAADKLIF